MQTAVIVATGREQGIATPVNDAVLDTIKAIEAGELGMEWANFEDNRAARRAMVAAG